MIEAQCPEWVVQVVMRERNREGRIIEANKEIMDTHIYLNNKRFQVRRKNERSVVCTNDFSLDIKKNIAKE